MCKYTMVRYLIYTRAPLILSSEILKKEGYILAPDVVLFSILIESASVSV